MIAYSEDDLYSCYVSSQALQAFDAYEIDEESYSKIRKAYPCKLYTPSYFIAVALGLVTIISVVFSTILIGLLFQVESNIAFSALSIFMLIVCYLFLEVIVRRKKYFNAGVDNILMVGVLFFSAGIFFTYSENHSWILMNGTLMIISLWLCLRFGDAFMAILSCSFLLITSFLCFLKLDVFVIEFFPFVIMVIIGALYFMIHKLQSNVKMIHEKSLETLSIFLLIAFYASGNYWIVDQLQSSVTNVSQPLALAWFFWIFTFVVPILYIAYGILKKDLIKIRVGLVLVLALVFTYKYYFNLLSVEIEMLIAGVILIVLSFFLIKFLRPSRYGFTSENTNSRPGWKDAEALVIAKTMDGVINPSNDSSLMSGGSGGGGGASGDF